MQGGERVARFGFQHGQFLIGIDRKFEEPLFLHFPARDQSPLLLNQDDGARIGGARLIRFAKAAPCHPGEGFALPLREAVTDGNRQGQTFFGITQSESVVFLMAGHQAKPANCATLVARILQLTGQLQSVVKVSCGFAEVAGVSLEVGDVQQRVVQGRTKPHFARQIQRAV